MGVIKRNTSVDLLRTIGLLCIVLAHVSPPAIIFQIRNFDVVLMVFLSGLSFSLGKTGKKGDYIVYVMNRFKRLIVPTWIFLSIYFVLIGLLGVKETLYIYLSSYSLVSGIGYVWVIRVYFLMALVAPLFWKSLMKVGVKKYLGIIVIVYSIYELTLMIIEVPDNLFCAIGMLVIPYVVGYGLVFSIGMCIKKWGVKNILQITMYMLAVFVILLFVNRFDSTQGAKYPPRAYYLLYGMIVSLILYTVVEQDFMMKIKTNKVIQWISENSLWIYFWHIIPLKLIDMELFNYNNFIIRYCLVILIAILITLVQNSILLIISTSRK